MLSLSPIMAHRTSAAALVITAFALMVTLLPAQEQAHKPEESAAVAEARAHVAGFHVTAIVDGRESEIELLTTPLLMYGDVARNNEGGTVWAWGKAGRPVAFLELYRNVGGNQP